MPLDPSVPFNTLLHCNLAFEISIAIKTSFVFSLEANFFFLSFCWGFFGKSKERDLCFPGSVCTHSNFEQRLERLSLAVTGGLKF